MEFITIGKCLNVRKVRGTYFYEGHFKGAFVGNWIKTIKLKGNKGCQELEENKEYIIHAKVNKIESGILCAALLRVKNINNMRKDFL